MQIIVSDTSCLLDLREGALLGLCFRLPYEFIIPSEMFDKELLSFSNEEKQYLRALGLQTRDLDSEQMTLVQEHIQNHRPLTAEDCYALALAQTTGNAILLTGDRNLRSRSESLDIETHGVIWALDQMLEHDCCSIDEGLQALIGWRENPAVFLPEQELEIRITRLKSK